MSTLKLVIRSITSDSGAPPLSRNSKWKFLISTEYTLISICTIPICLSVNDFCTRDIVYTKQHYSKESLSVLAFHAILKGSIANRL